MDRRTRMVLVGLVVLTTGVVTGCAATASDIVAEGSPPNSEPDAFAGTWRSVTPPYEFIGLVVASKSSEMGVMGARLTLSGTAWEGSGRIDGDSLLIPMAVTGTTTSTGVIVARAQDARTLRVQFRPAGAPAVDLTLVRED